MENIITLSQQTNWGFNTKNTQLFLDSAYKLYNYVQRNNPILLTTIDDSSNLQTIGMAFSYSARFIDYGDTDINSVAAENAYYCLAKSIKLGNFYAAPKLYNLLYHNSNLLISKFIAARMDEIQKQYNVKIGMLYGNPFLSEDAKDESAKFILPVRFYIISKFYDIRLNKTLIPDDLIDYSDENIISDINNLLKATSYEESVNIGEIYFNKVYTEIEKTISSL